MINFQEGVELDTTPRSHFLDSGSFSLMTLEAPRWSKEHGEPVEAYYDSPEFWAYMDRYAEFVHKYSAGIDHHANVDVIGDPVTSLRNLKYLEGKGLKPVPIVHFGSDMKWIRYYIDHGYEYLGLGGLVVAVSNYKGGGDVQHAYDWLNKAFQIICDGPGNLPKVKVHGFGITRWDMVSRYPWWSTDSTSWVKHGAYGRILVPHWRKGKWDFGVQPYAIPTSEKHSWTKVENAHLLNLRPAEKRTILNWLEFIGVPLGSDTEKGVINDDGYRIAANLLFTEHLANAQPEWPWPFTLPSRPLFPGVLS